MNPLASRAVLWPLSVLLSAEISATAAVGVVVATGCTAGGMPPGVAMVPAGVVLPVGCVPELPAVLCGAGATGGCGLGANFRATKAAKSSSTPMTVFFLSMKKISLARG